MVAGKNRFQKLSSDFCICVVAFMYTNTSMHDKYMKLFGRNKKIIANNSGNFKTEHLQENLLILKKETTNLKTDECNLL